MRGHHCGYDEVTYVHDGTSQHLKTGNGCCAVHGSSLLFVPFESTQFASAIKHNRDNLHVNSDDFTPCKVVQREHFLFPPPSFVCGTSVYYVVCLSLLLSPMDGYSSFLMLASSAGPGQNAITNERQSGGSEGDSRCSQSWAIYHVYWVCVCKRNGQTAHFADTR